MQVKGKLKFTKGDNDFYQTVKKRVNQYFASQEISPYGNATMYLKTIILFLAYLGPFVGLLFVPLPLWAQLLLWTLMGLSTAGIGMSVMHDANHGAYSPNAKLNRIIGYSINLVGGIAHNWKLQHNILHHTYTNIAFMDDDIEPKGGIRMTPHHPEQKMQRHQQWYAFVLYGISTLYWVSAKDFMQLYRYSRNGVNPNRPKQNQKLWLRIITLKAAYHISLIGLPIWIGGMSWWATLLGFTVMHLISGTVLSVVFQMAHIVEGASHPLPNDEGRIETNWAIHQMKTTCNFSPNHRLLSWYLGGLNYQIEHHLFPKICHVHYPAIAPIVEQTAKEFGVPYVVNPRLSDAFLSHVQTLKRLGKQPDLDDLIG